MKKATNNTNKATNKANNKFNINQLLIDDINENNFIKLDNKKAIEEAHKLLLSSIDKQNKKAIEDIKKLNYNEFQSNVSKAISKKQTDKSKQVAQSKLLLLSNDIEKKHNKINYLLDTCENKHKTNFERRKKQLTKYINNVESFEQKHEEQIKDVQNKFDLKIKKIELQKSKIKKDDESKLKYYSKKIENLKEQLKLKIENIENSKNEELKNEIEKLISFEFHTRRNLIFILSAFSISKTNIFDLVQKIEQRQEKSKKLIEAII